MLVDHMWQGPSDSSFGFSVGYRADVPSMTLDEVADLKTLNFDFEKIFSRSTSRQPLRVVTRYENSGPNVHVLDVIFQL